MDVLEMTDRAYRWFMQKVEGVPDDAWHAPTPCSEWDVRALVNHIAVEDMWVPLLGSGKTVADVGDTLDGDQLGDDPKATYRAAAEAALAVWHEPHALERSFAVSRGPTPGLQYLSEMFFDRVVHGWDLAVATGQPARIDEDLAQAAYDIIAPAADGGREEGWFGPQVPAPEGADIQTRLLSVSGRDRVAWERR